MYFVHERGFRIALLTCALGAISSLVSVITGPITTNLGWKYCFWILLPFCSVQFILMLLFSPESSYNRETMYGRTNENFEQLYGFGMKVDQTSSPSKENTDVLEHNTTRVPSDVSSRAVTPRKTFFQQLALVDDIYSEDHLIRLFFAPFVVLTNIAAAWTIVMSGLIVGWYVSVSFIIAQWFSAPPYNYTPAAVGYLWVGPAVGGLVASLFMFAISDPLIKFCGKRNRGIYEPEFRLYPMTLCLIFTVLGLALYGYGLQQYWNPLITSFVLGVMLFGILIGSIASSAYILDGFHSLSNEVFVASMAFKNLLFYSMSYYVNNWVAVRGPMQMFGVFAGISAFFILLGVPMFIWGKRYRSFWARHNVMTFAGFKSRWWLLSVSCSFGWGDEKYD